VRYNKKLRFHEDSSCKPQKGRDVLGRKYVEDWGWIGGPKAMWDAEQWAARVDRPWRANEVKSRLRELLHHAWTDRWIKAKSYRRRPHPAVPRLGVHVSVHRILLEAKQKHAVPRRQ